MFIVGRTTKSLWNICGPRLLWSLRNGKELPRWCMSWTILLRMVLRGAFRILRMICIKLGSSRTSNIWIMGLNKDTNSEIRSRPCVSCWANLESCSMKENLQSRRGRNLAGYNRVVVPRMTSMNLRVSQPGQLLALAKRDSMGALEVKTLRN